MPSDFRMTAEDFVARMMPTWVNANFTEAYTVKWGEVSRAEIFSFRHCNRTFRVWPRVGVLPERFSVCLEREVIAHIIGWDYVREVWEWAWVHPPSGSELIEIELILP